MYKKLLALAKLYGRKLSAEQVEAAGISAEQMPRLLLEIINANDEANIALILPLDRKFIDPYYVNEQGLTPLQIAVNLRRWDHVLAIVSTPGIDHLKVRTGSALLVATQENETLIVDSILQYHCNMNFHTPDNGFSALHWAIFNNNEVILEALLANNVKPSFVTTHNTSPAELVLNAKPIQPGLIKILCKYGADFLGILKKAAQAGNWELVNLILKNDPRDKNAYASILILEAITQNNIERAKEMVAFGGDFYTPFETGSALIQVIREQLYPFVELALEQQHTNKNQVLEYALPRLAEAKQWDLVGKTIDLTTNLNGHFNNVATVHFLVGNNQEDLLRKLLIAGASVDHSTTVTRLPLAMAVSMKNENMIGILCNEFNAKVDSVINNALADNSWDDIKLILNNDNRNHPIYTKVLIAAAQAQQKEVVELLLSRGASLSEAIKTTCEKKQWEAFKYLVKAWQPDEAKPSLASVLNPLLDQVIKADEVAIMLFMLENGADRQKAIKTTSDDENFPCAIALANSSDPSLIGDLGRVLLTAAQKKNWDVVKALIKPGVSCDWRTNPEQKFTIHHIAEAGRVDLLTQLLGIGCPPNIDSSYPSALEIAEKQHNAEAIAVLVENGATHHSAIIRAANNLKWDQMFDLLAEHYDIRPNRNETEEDKQIVLGELLHIVVRKNDVNTLKTLLIHNVDVTSLNDEQSILHTIATNGSWNLVLALIEENKLGAFSANNRFILMQKAIAKGVPFTTLEKICPFVDLAQRDESGEGLVHLAIRSNNAGALELLVLNRAPTTVPNNDKKLPLRVLLELTKNGTIKKELGERMAKALTGSTEWVDAQQFELKDENIQSDEVETARNMSYEALFKRYPNVDVNKALLEYRTFLGHLPAHVQGNMRIEYGIHGTYRIDDNDLKQYIAVVWAAACDENALPECEPKDDPERIRTFVELRKIAVVEKIYQARVETKSTGSCGRGYKTKLIEALHSAHPDVIICYSKSLTKDSVRDHAIPIISSIGRKQFLKMSVAEQRAFAVEFVAENDNAPQFFVDLSPLVAQRLTPQYGDLLPKADLLQVVAPEAIRYVKFTPFKELDALITKIDKLKHPEDRPELTELKKRAQNAYNPTSTISLDEEFAQLKQHYQQFLDTSSSQQLQNLSLLKAPEKDNDSTHATTTSMEPKG